jgi:hypothetical protein
MFYRVKPHRSKRRPVEVAGIPFLGVFARRSKNFGHVSNCVDSYLT